MTPREVLMLPMQENDADATTVGGYLQALVRKVWEEDEGFSGKRPFGNSDWARELHRAVIAGGAADGKLDADGYVDDKGNADQVIFDAIDALWPEPAAVVTADKIAAFALRREADRLDPPAGL